jgi:hypothetical protein
MPWIRIEFNVMPDLAFYLNADPEWCQANADPDLNPDPFQSLSQKVEFIHGKILLKKCNTIKPTGTYQVPTYPT